MFRSIRFVRGRGGSLIDLLGRKWGDLRVLLSFRLLHREKRLQKGIALFNELFSSIPKDRSRRKRGSQGGDLRAITKTNLTNLLLESLKLVVARLFLFFGLRNVIRLALLFPLQESREGLGGFD